MSGVIRRTEPTRARRGNRPGLLLLLSAVVPVGLAVSVVLGVGLERNLPAQGALLGALLITLLPLLGLASPARNRAVPAAIGVAGWLWSAALLLAVPQYFPGELGPATRAGVTWMAAPLGEEVAQAFADAGEAVLVAVVPSEAPPPSAAELPPVEEAPREPRAVPVAAAVEVADEPVPTEGPTGRVVLPYEGGGRSMRVLATFQGPRTEVTHTMLFDTGATLTTLSAEALDELGAGVPPDAPIVTLNTAGGQVQAPLVLLDGVALGLEEVPWATVALCEACAEAGVSGLLGLNVTGLFQVSLDHEEQEIDLTRRGRRVDRLADVTHWVELGSTAKVWSDGRIEVEVTAENRARAAVADLSIEVACADRSFAVSLDDVPARGARTTRVSLPRGTDCREYRVMLREGRWGH